MAVLSVRNGPLPLFKCDYEASNEDFYIKMNLEQCIAASDINIIHFEIDSVPK